MNSASTIERVIHDRSFDLVYQPIVHLDTATVAGVEALCRFRDGASTETRFQESEALGVAADLDVAIIQNAFEDLPRLPPGFLAINLSASTLLDPRLSDLLLAPGVPTRRLVLEVTEHAQIADYEVAEQLLGEIRNHGVRIAVDDAGAGYATFRHILSLKPEIIKMDRSITQDIDCDKARQALATALAIFAGEVGASVVAEGVETNDEIHALRRAGIDRAQGYALARPAPLPLPPLRYQPQGIEALLNELPTDLAYVSIQEDEPELDRAAAHATLVAAVRAQEAARIAIDRAVAACRRADVTWQEVGDALRMTRQGARQRGHEG
jgi:EAL domain-containing protein (putative c-di-GMP-specific phosphodiesterase class I)